MGHTDHTGTARSRREQIPSGQIMLEGELSFPVGAAGVVLLAHGSWRSRHSDLFGRVFFPGTIVLGGEASSEGHAAGDDPPPEARSAKVVRNEWLVTAGR